MPDLSHYILVNPLTQQLVTGFRYDYTTAKKRSADFGAIVSNIPYYSKKTGQCLKYLLPAGRE